MIRVANVLLIQKNRILLLHNNKHNPHRIEPPGGRIEYETPEKCAIREAKEELGIDVEIFKFLGNFYSVSEKGIDVEVYSYLGNFHGKPEIKEPHRFSSFGWYSYEQLIEFKNQKMLAPNLVQCLDLLKNLLS